MSVGTCSGCKKMTNSATSDWWFTPNFTPTKCYIAWENKIAIHGCAFDKLTPGAQFLYQEMIDNWNINSKKTDKEHLDDILVWNKKSTSKRKSKQKEVIKEPEESDED